MPKLMCEKDDTGYWTVGCVYAAESVLDGSCTVGDDEFPNGGAPDGDWIAEPLSYSDDDEKVTSYYLPGMLDGQVEFVAVE